MDVPAMLEADHTIDEKRLRELVVGAVGEAYDRKVAEIGPNIMHEIEKQIMLRQLDSHWKEHIGALDYLRQGIHLRGYAQRNPKQEYKREAFEMFSTMLERVKHDTISILSKIQIRRPEDVQAVEPAMPDPSTLKFQHAAAPALVPAAPAPSPSPDARPPAGPGPGAPGMRPPPLPSGDPVAPYVREAPKVGRNDPCPCGSGKKFKQCHGRLS
jgi:preprotein translocase subunit SecA